MNTIGERITKFRKEKGMTQEDLASTIGVSAQSVSKWENNMTMPDIMLLPLLSDIFGITIDELFGKSTQKTADIQFDDLPEEAFNILLQTMQHAWNNMEQSPEVSAVETKRHLTEHQSSQTAIYSEKGSAVYVNHEIGIIFRKEKDQLLDLLHDKVSADLLEALSDTTFRKIMEYQLCNSGIAFTAPSIAKKLGIDTGEAKTALEKLVKYAFTSCR